MYSYKILQNWTKNLFHSSILSFESQTYMFNCSDGTQRNAIEQGVKFHKINNIFFNSCSVETHLGTYGFSMTRNEQVTGQLIAHSNNSQKIKEEEAKNKSAKAVKAKAKKEESPPDKRLYLWAPPDFKQNFYKVGGFFFEGICDYVREYDLNSESFIDSKNTKQSFFQDENIQIIPICVKSNDYVGSEKNNSCMSYICIPNRKKPPFLPDKAISLGLKPGPQFKDLQDGKSVLIGEKEVRPEDVLGISPPTSCIMILFSMTVDHAVKLVSSEIFQRYTIGNIDSQAYEISHIVHILGDEAILSNIEYQKFICSFGPHVVHIIDSPLLNTKFMLNEGKVKIKSILNTVSPVLFDMSMINQSDFQPNIILKEKTAEFDCYKHLHIIESLPGYTFQLNPKIKNGTLQEKIYESFLLNDKEFVTFKESLAKHVDEYKNEIAVLDKMLLSCKNHGEYSNQPEVLFLGTVSMKPGIFRNVSAVMIRLIENNNFTMLLDCGEGTYQQLYDHFGRQVNEILLKLKLIFITHKHGDHMLGFLKVLLEIDKIKKENKVDTKVSWDSIIYVVVPVSIIDWVKRSIENEFFYKDHIVVLDNEEVNPNGGLVYQKYILQDNPNEDFDDVKELTFNEIDEKIETFMSKVTGEVKNFYEFSEKVLGLRFFSVEVFHCNDSYGCFLQDINKTWKISYSGDTRPCNNFKNFTAKSTLILHEATFEDGLEQDARNKMHSTFSDGIKLSKENNSNKICLTHFSPRYIKYIPMEEQHIKEEILFSHDFLQFNLSQLPVVFNYLKIFSPLMKKLEVSRLI